jgi:hypothetical protein
MTKKTRLALFLISLFLFFLLGTISIAYSQGYRFDFKAKRIVQTGGIYLKVTPGPANVFIDGKFKGKTDFLFGTIFIKNLLPGKHKIKVEKENAFPWEKNLEIKEKEVTEAKNIVLIPRDLNLKVLDLKEIPPGLINTTTSEPENFNDTYYLNDSGHLFKNGGKLVDQAFKNFKISPDSKKIALVNDYEIWLLFLKDPSASREGESSKELFLTRFSKEIGEIFWYNSDYLISRVGPEIKITEIDNRDRLNIFDLANFGGELKIFFEQTNKKLYILNQGNLFVSEALKI